MIRRIPAAMFALITLGLTSPAVAQGQTGPWSADYTHERASVSINGTDDVWSVDHAQAMWSKPDEGGWLAAIDRQERFNTVNVTLSTRAYRRAGDWTYAGGVAATPDATFLYRAAADGEISRRVVKTIVATGGYQYLSFRSATIHQFQPAVTWYFPLGEFEVHGFVTHNTTTDRTTNAVMVRSTFGINPRLQISGGASYGTRIFDVAALPTDTAMSRVGFASTRIGITSHDFLVVGTTVARETPAFSYASITLGYRRVF